ncbi:MarR family winged helix-turn-helix transcriptional regulator [Lichenicoccus sp.]|uniref:MarR family winged helix-turn-helix transcriptional regulator n=1 Tax=Lichenicoccus sp. TaxID=2781899 RepID=UPI003D0FBFF1
MDADALAAKLRSVLSKLRRRLREQANPTELTPSQVAALSRLDRDGPLTTSALARAEGVRSQSMGATVAVLQTAGLVSGEPDPADRRQTLLSLTPACRDRVTVDRAARQDWLVRIIDRELAPDELRRLASALTLLRRIADA